MLIAVEVGLSHLGCLGTAMAFADAIADAGADIYKAQCHLGDQVDKYRPGMENYFHETRQEYWRRTAFTPDQWRKLADKCHKRGLKFACSCFSVEGIEAMSTIVDILKVPSSKTHDAEFLKAAARTGKPIVLSTGMSDTNEIDRALGVLEDNGCRCPTVLHCASEYPTPPEHIHIDAMPYPWGLSDHSGVIFPGIAAAAHGADMLEVHCCFSKMQWGPDVSSSLTIEQLKQLVEGVRFVTRMIHSHVTKDELAAQLEPVRRVFRGA